MYNHNIVHQLYLNKRVKKNLYLNNWEKKKQYPIDTKQTHRSIEENRELTTKPTFIGAVILCQKKQEYTIRKRQPL